MKFYKKWSKIHYCTNLRKMPPKSQRRRKTDYKGQVICRLQFSTEPVEGLCLTVVPGQPPPPPAGSADLAYTETLRTSAYVCVYGLYKLDS